MKQTVTDTPSSLNPTPFEQLPLWDLGSMYKSLTDPQIEQDLKECNQESLTFRNKHLNNIDRLSPAELATAIGQYEKLGDRLGKLGAYAFLSFATATQDPEIGQFYQQIKEKTTDISNNILFFSISLTNSPKLEAWIASAETSQYHNWLKILAESKPHLLSVEVEEKIQQKDLCGRQAWVRLFDETINNLQVTIDDSSVAIGEAINRLSNPDENIRKAAFYGLSKSFTQQAPLVLRITNNLAKDHNLELQWRKYARPDSPMNLSNRVLDPIVTSLVETVEQAYPRLSHRYYKLKAQWFGKDKLDIWDRNAPLPKVEMPSYSWEAGKELVLEAFGAFSPKMRQLTEQFFAKNWIDARPRQGKDIGAFCHSTVASHHPYVLLNYYQKPRDVMTLAHELGHGVHQCLSASQGDLMCHAPLTLAETASVFGEMLVFQRLLQQITDSKIRKFLIASKVEDMLNTVVRQIAFYKFEWQIHNNRGNGELQLADIQEFWLNTQRECLGPSVRFDQDYANFWAYISHFIHAPFYVYSYAFGDCLVNSLYSAYSEAKDPTNFVEKYLNLLRAGGSISPAEALKSFGFGELDHNFWQKGLNLISRYIDELEKIGN